MKCPNCEAVMINGIFCHETNCPSNYLYVQKECKWCGQMFQNNGEEYIGDYCDNECRNSYIGV